MPHLIMAFLILGVNVIAATDDTSANLKKLKDPDPTIRAEAAGNLGSEESPEAISALEIALKDKDSRVRVSAVHALGRMGKKTFQLSCQPLMIVSIPFERKPSSRLPSLNLRERRFFRQLKKFC